MPAGSYTPCGSALELRTIEHGLKADLQLPFDASAHVGRGQDHVVVAAQECHLPDLDGLTVHGPGKAELEPGVIVDCSHGNSEKDHQRQAIVAADICDQIEQGQSALRGVMLESHLVAGNQAIGPRDSLRYGQSITDACLSLQDTLPVLDSLAAAVRRARL